ncbi:MAG TPA: GMC family oxidoreductase [Kiloniellaceae bacterium]|nr:GMC family oxidoreductase [Kiloniellaceae bacterium]
MAETFDDLQSVLLETTPGRVASLRVDVIVVGGGAAGGLASLLLCEAGLRVLTLDAGVRKGFFQAPYSRALSAVVTRVATPEMFERLPLSVSNLGRKALRLAGRLRQPVQSRCFAWELQPDCLVDDRDNPYLSDPEGPFCWFRSRQLGGRMTVPGHGRQYYRLSAADLDPRDGLSPSWPVTAEDLAPWYALVERRLGLHGRREGHPWVPDSEIAQAIEPTPAESDLMTAIGRRWPHLQPIAGRFAPPLASLAQAARTGRLACRQGVVVRQIHVDGEGAVCGVSFVDDASGAELRVEAPLVFLCASTLESTRLLMLSRSTRHPEGLGGASGALGRNLMDHVVMSGRGFGPALPGGRATLVDGRSVYVPRFDLQGGEDGQAPGAGRGFGVQLYRMSKGADASFFQAVAFAEMTPRPDNRIALDGRVKDRWGVPALAIRCRHSAQEIDQARRQSAALQAIADVLGVRLTDLNTAPTPPGMAIHECGTARMGSTPESSVLDPFNQCWDAKGLYVTDGACFPSQGAQNPTLTIMALTARACDHALRGLKASATTVQPDGRPATARPLGVPVG